MIRLGSLAGYPFEGPRVLAGWTAPAVPAVYAVVTRNDAESKPQEFSVIYIGHADDLSSVKFPFRDPRSPALFMRAGSKWNLHICFYEVPGGLRSHREQITRELISIYKPSCNPDQYDRTWKDTWIGAYQTPMTGPLTTGHAPDSARSETTGDQSAGR
ncbi:MAG: hypothetical protein VW685_01460 [Ilumatobacter sp.]